MRTLWTSLATPRRRRAALGVGVVAATAFALTGLGPVQAAPNDNGLFQLNDADVDDDTAPPDTDATSDDWENVYGGTDHAFVTTVGSTGMGGIVADPAPTSIFTGGGSKDDLDFNQWAWKNGSVPDKDDITNAYAAAYAQGGDTYVYFGMDRFATEGSSFVGAWLIQDDGFAPVAGSPAGSFNGAHTARDVNDPSDPHDDTPGDVLVLSEFDEGGTGITIKVFEWVGSGGDEGGGTLQTIFGGDTGVAADCNDTTTSALVCANVNTEKILNADVPWQYEAKKEKGQPVLDIPVGAFFEGGINLTDLFGTTPCFSDIVLETRSSFETNAVLKDFVASEFELCGAEVSIAPDDVNDVGESHTFTVTASRTVAGVPEPASLAAGDLDVSLTDANGGSITPTTDECANTSQADGTCQVTFTSNVPGTITGHVEGVITIGDTTIEVATGGTGQNPDATKVFVDSRITITPDDTNGIGEYHTFTVDVDENDGSSEGWVAATNGDVDYTLTPAGDASVILDAVTSTCDNEAADPADFFDNLDASGQCVIRFRSDSAGTVTGHASVAVRINSTEGEIEVNRNTDGLSDFGSSNSDDAVKTYVDGTLRWLKVDDRGNPLGGATFRVCQTHTYNSADGTFTVIDTNPTLEGNQPDCVTVVDDGPNDADADPAQFQRNGQKLGKYTVKETVAPEGYALDPDTEELVIVIDNPSTTDDESFDQPTHVVEGETVPKPFVDPALYKLIVLTCNTTTEKLVASEVDLDPSTTGGVKDTLTLPAGDPSHASLCALGGASYDDLTRATYGLNVKIPK